VHKHRLKNRIFGIDSIFVQKSYFPQKFIGKVCLKNRILDQKRHFAQKSYFLQKFFGKARVSLKGQIRAEKKSHLLLIFGKFIKIEQFLFLRHVLNR
jgi:hypothetical protein